MAENPEVGDQPAELEEENIPGAVGLIKAKFEDAEQGRLSDENRWLKAYKNYRGVYDSSTQFKDSERSRIFVKVTKTKVIASFGQLTDILFANGEVPISIEATPVPDGISEVAGLDPTGKFNQMGVIDPPELPGLGQMYGGSQNLYEGPKKLPDHNQIKPAQEAALKMQKVIRDQFTETNAISVLRHSLFECVMLGTGVVKGPFHHTKTLHNWVYLEGGQKQYAPVYKPIPLFNPCINKCSYSILLFKCLIIFFLISFI